MPDPKTNSYLIVVQSYPHLGPITDFCIARGTGNRTLELLGDFEMAPTSIPALDENKPTLHLANVVCDQIIPVTGEDARLLDSATMTDSPHPAWNHPKIIVFNIELVIVNK